MVKRIYVEKKKGFDVEATGLYGDLKQNLELEGLAGIRVINRYDVDCVRDDIFEMAKLTVFAEPSIDVVYDEELPKDISSTYFLVEYLPGQYDQRADSAAQCIKLIDSETDAKVKFARLVVIEGKVSDTDMAAIKKYCINPVDSREANSEKPVSLEMETVVPEDVKIVAGFIHMNDEQLLIFKKEMGFAMSEADIRFVQSYFLADEKRNPTITELKVIDTYWSDHCRHTTFQTELTDIDFDGEQFSHTIKDMFDEYLEMREEVYGVRTAEKSICLMDLACIGAKYLKKKGMIADLDESEEINACSIKVKAKVDGEEQDWLVMFKNETHNHPTEIEPFGGAATCLGGAIRDPLSGRVYVYQAMRVTGAADPRIAVKDTMAGKLPQKKITQQAAHGYSSYGNQIGLATGQVEEIYHPDYVAKRMEIGAVVGAAPASHVVRCTPIEGDVIILLGGKTGRDGCGGATGSSKEHTEESILTCGAEVQKGNPPVERNIQRMFRRKEVATLIKRCNDFGAGGVSVAIGELADSLDVNLDLVPKKYDGLDGTELAISESQERMAVVISAENAEKFKAYADEENLEATLVAKVTSTGRVRMYWRGNSILDIKRDFLNTNGATQQAKVLVKGKAPMLDVKASAEDCLNDLNCCSRKGLIERFDSTIGAASVLMPLGGKHQLSPAVGMAAKLPVTEGETETATIMAYGFDPYLSKSSTFHGAMCAVVDSVTKLVAMGGDYKKARLTFQEYYERMTADPATWGKPFAALLGALKVQKELGIPSIGGKDSMSGTFGNINVPPTLVSFAIEAVSAADIISTEFKAVDSKLIYLKAEYDQNGVICFDTYKTNMEKATELTGRGKILAANVVGAGGIFISIVKMSVGNKIGATIVQVAKEELYSPSYGSLILEVAADEDVEALFTGIEYRVIGNTTSEARVKFAADGIDMGIDDIVKCWTAPLEEVFPTRTKDFKNVVDDRQVTKICHTERNSSSPAIKIAKPRIVIPTFPGTNCEMDSKRAFEKAGGQADIHIIRNLTAAGLDESIKELADKIRQSQIVMIPGGFSGGDEPDGSAKFIIAVFRNPMIMEAVEDLLQNRDGLMLGICNGFQALIKLGLVPYGKITPANENSPTLTYNTIGRHVSGLVRTKITSVKSPWLALEEVGNMHTIAVSHGEGRFIASDVLIEELIANGQVASQYVDLAGNPSMDIAYNPNGSLCAIEGITSPDGRVLGKMAHSERIRNNVYKNVDGHKEQRIFEAGVNYFK